MKNILAERVLGLPGDVRTDKEADWSEVPRLLTGHRRAGPDRGPPPRRPTAAPLSIRLRSRPADRSHRLGQFQHGEASRAHAAAMASAQPSRRIG